MRILSKVLRPQLVPVLLLFLINTMLNATIGVGARSTVLDLHGNIQVALAYEFVLAKFINL